VEWVGLVERVGLAKWQGPAQRERWAERVGLAERERRAEWEGPAECRRARAT